MKRDVKHVANLTFLESTTALRQLQIRHVHSQHWKVAMKWIRSIAENINTLNCSSARRLMISLDNPSSQACTSERITSGIGKFLETAMDVCLSLGLTTSSSNPKHNFPFNNSGQQCFQRKSKLTFRYVINPWGLRGESAVKPFQRNCRQFSHCLERNRKTCRN